MPWIKHAETRIILFETGSKNSSQTSQSFRIFSKIRGLNIFQFASIFILLQGYW